MQPVASGSTTPTVEHVHSPLDDELERDEALFERYGGDDPEDPPLPTSSQSSTQHDDTAQPITHEPGKRHESHLVSWDGPQDPQNPQHWSRRYKWFVTVLMSILSVNVTFASSAPSSAITLIEADFSISPEVSYLVTSIFVVGYVFGPIFWGPGSETVGRRPILATTLWFYTIFHLGQALAKNMQTLLVTRFLSGFFACAPLTIGGGLIADIWDPVGRGPATSIFSTTVFLGPCLGPLIGGFIVQSGVGWRWVFWVEMIFAGTCAFLATVFIPETYAPVILLKKARHLRKVDPVGNKDLFAEAERHKWSIPELAHRTLARPFIMLSQEPILVLITIYLSMAYGVIYALFEALPIIFIERHGLTVSQDGMIFIGVAIGAAIGAAINHQFSREYPLLLKQWRGFPPAEKRLRVAMVGCPSLVIGAFWLGWTGEYESVPWYVPALATIPLGCGISSVFIGFLSYLVDTYLMYSASAFAANTIIRSIVGAAFPLFTVQMYDNLGINWASTLIGCIALLLAPMPFLFYKYGPIIRQRSKFAPCLDLKIAKEMEAERRAQAEKLDAVQAV